MELDKETVDLMTKNFIFVIDNLITMKVNTKEDVRRVDQSITTLKILAALFSAQKQKEEEDAISNKNSGV